MSNIEEIRNALNVFLDFGFDSKQITLLHCTSEYPPRMEDVNLKAMATMAKTFNLSVGYSDHTLGIEVSIAAASLGASVIEKHLTLDRNDQGPDHKASLEPKQFNELVLGIRNIEKALGSEVKSPTSAEKDNKLLVRKSIVASKSIKKGEFFTEFNITTKRPGNGICPMDWDEIIGKKASRDFFKDELIKC